MEELLHLVFSLSQLTITVPLLPNTQAKKTERQKPKPNQKTRSRDSKEDRERKKKRNYLAYRLYSESSKIRKAASVKVSFNIRR